MLEYISPSILTAVTPSSRSSAMSSDLEESSYSAEQRGDSSGWSNTAESQGAISFYSSPSYFLRGIGPKADKFTAVAGRTEAREEEVDRDFTHNHLTERLFDMAALTPEMIASLAFLASLDKPTLEIAHYPHLCTILTGLSKIVFGENTIYPPSCSSPVSTIDFSHLQTSSERLRSSSYTPASRFPLMAAPPHTLSLSICAPSCRHKFRCLKSSTNQIL